MLRMAGRLIQGLDPVLAQFAGRVLVAASPPRLIQPAQSGHPPIDHVSWCSCHRGAVQRISGEA